MSQWLTTHCVDCSQPMRILTGVIFREGLAVLCDACLQKRIRIVQAGGHIDPRKRPLMRSSTECRHGHDLTVPGARYASGECRRCKKLRNAIYATRRRDAA